jgi:hypothetical protein
VNRTLRHVFSFLAASALALLAACGGGGSVASGPTAEGVYGGNLTGATSPNFLMLVLDSGEVWATYGTRSSANFAVSAFVQGFGSSGNGLYTSPDVRDFGALPATIGQASASYNAAAKTITGTITLPTGNVGFSGGPIAGSLYNHDTPALLTSVAGTWTLTSLSGDSVAFTVQPSGLFTAAASPSGCAFSGALTPRSSGKNVFNVVMSFGPAPCALASQTATGIALAYPLANGTTQFLLAGYNTARTVGTAVFGVR